jgi:hypothetical protein
MKVEPVMDVADAFAAEIEAIKWRDTVRALKNAQASTTGRIKSAEGTP